MNLPKKPKREDFYDLYCGTSGDLVFARAERDYHKAVAEFAVGALKKIDDEDWTMKDAESTAATALEAIHQTEQST